MASPSLNMRPNPLESNWNMMVGRILSRSRLVDTRRFSLTDPPFPNADAVGKDRSASKKSFYKALGFSAEGFCVY